MPSQDPPRSQAPRQFRRLQLTTDRLKENSMHFMGKIFASAGLFVACLFAAPGVAHADYSLLVKSNCLACHQIDKRKYGPKLNEIAAKYASDSGALETLASKIKQGGTGVWGEDIMPPQPHLSDADARALARYVLSLK